MWVAKVSRISPWQIFPRFRFATPQAIGDPLQAVLVSILGIAFCKSNSQQPSATLIQIRTRQFAKKHSFRGGLKKAFLELELEQRSPRLLCPVGGASWQLLDDAFAYQLLSSSASCARLPGAMLIDTSGIIGPPACSVDSLNSFVTRDCLVQSANQDHIEGCEAFAESRLVYLAPCAKHFLAYIPVARRYFLADFCTRPACSDQVRIVEEGRPRVSENVRRKSVAIH
jgi:hypothetical protein